MQPSLLRCAQCRGGGPTDTRTRRARQTPVPEARPGAAAHALRRRPRSRRAGPARTRQGATAWRVLLIRADAPAAEAKVRSEAASRAPFSLRRTAATLAARRTRGRVHARASRWPRRARQTSVRARRGGRGRRYSCSAPPAALASPWRRGAIAWRAFSLSRADGPFAAATFDDELPGPEGRDYEQ